MLGVNISKYLFGDEHFGISFIVNKINKKQLQVKNKHKTMYTAWILLAIFDLNSKLEYLSLNLKKN